MCGRVGSNAVRGFDNLERWAENVRKVFSRRCVRKQSIGNAVVLVVIG